METLPADLSLAFETRKIIMRELLELRNLPSHHQSFYSLGKQKLMMKGDECTFVLQRKDNPDSHRT